jgi:hypothetical protein
MGGPGSGTWYRWDRRTTLDARDYLDVRVLAQRGALRAGVHATIAWRQGQPSENSIGFVYHDDYVILEYRARHGSTDWYPVRQEIALERTLQPFGGKRVWFRCPECQRRVALLYSGRQGYVCRRCMKLPYSTQCMMRQDRLYRKVRRMRTRIGASGNLLEPIRYSGKPRGMHWKTFERLRAQAEDVHMEVVEEMNLALARLLGRYVPQGDTSPLGGT